MSTTINVSPLEIKRSVERGKQYEEALTVGNVGEERYTYRIQPEEGYRDWVDPDPDLFAINAQEDRVITLNLQPPDDAKMGVHRFSIAVINDDVEDDQAQVDVALRVPIPVLWWVILIVMVMILLAILIQWPVLVNRIPGG